MKNQKEGRDRALAALSRGNRSGALQFAKVYSLGNRARLAVGLSPKLSLDEKARRVAALRAATHIPNEKLFGISIQPAKWFVG